MRSNEAEPALPFPRPFKFNCFKVDWLLSTVVMGLIYYLFLFSEFGIDFDFDFDLINSNLIDFDFYLDFIQLVLILIWFD